MKMMKIKPHIHNDPKHIQSPTTFFPRILNELARTLREGTTIYAASLGVSDLTCLGLIYLVL